METNNRDRAPNDRKFRELVLFLAERCEGDPTFGSVKLDKLLFFADFFAYQGWGQAITWHRYQKLENGPAPGAGLPVLRRMEEEREIAFAEREYFGQKQKRVVALREPNLDVLTGREISLVLSLVDACRGLNAAQMSQMSDNFFGWKLAALNEDIPYEAALIHPTSPTDDMLEAGLELEDMAKECLSRRAANPA